MTDSVPRQAVSEAIYTVKPFVGVGELRFGLPRDRFREILGSASSSFSRGEHPAIHTDAFDAIGIQLSFDPEGCLEFVELYPPARVAYLGIALLGNGHSLLALTAELAARNLIGTKDDVGFDYPTAGFGLFTRDNTTIEAVSVYPSGYYDADVRL